MIHRTEKYCIFGSSAAFPKNELCRFFSRAACSYSRVCMIVDKNVYAIYGNLLTEALKSACLSPLIIALAADEPAKSLTSAAACWQQMSEEGLDRRSCVIAIGGGVILDLAGFVAACYMRGVDHYFIPTTLLAMVDAAIGGKAGINTAVAKNVIGCFKEPVQALFFPFFLQTLPERELVSGIAEVIKYAAITGESLFTFLENAMPKLLCKDADSLSFIVRACLTIKCEIVAKDPLDKTGERAALNFGHTLGHAIEALTDYAVYTHGEAVAIGCAAESRLSQLLGVAAPETVSRLTCLIKQACLPYCLPDFPIDKLVNALKKDKKSVDGKICLIVVEKIGKVFPLADLTENQIKKALETLYAKPAKGRLSSAFAT